MWKFYKRLYKWKNKCNIDWNRKKNFLDLKKNFGLNKNINISNKEIFEIEGKFDTILYLHVLEHIEDDLRELKEIEKKLN